MATRDTQKTTEGESRYSPVSPAWRLELAWRRWFLDQVEEIAEMAALPREEWHAGVCIAILSPIDDAEFTRRLADLKQLWERGEYNRNYSFLASDLDQQEMEVYIAKQLTTFGDYAELDRADDLDAQSQIVEYELHWTRWLMGELPPHWCDHRPASDYLDYFRTRRNEVEAKLSAVRDADAETIRAALRDVERQHGAKPVSELEPSASS